MPIMRDTRVTPTHRPDPSKTGRDMHKIRIPGLDGTHHTNPPEILAQIGSQRAARANLPGSIPDHQTTTPAIGKAGSVPHSPSLTPPSKRKGERPMAVRPRVAASVASALPEELLTIEEAAVRINMSVRYVRRLVAERRIVFYRLGRAVRFASADLAAFVQAGRVEPMTAEAVWSEMRRVA
jgi:excisionase family DNA binding protein